MRASDGVARIYGRKGISSAFCSSYFLEKEILGNGKIIRYIHDGYNFSRIESLDPTEQYIYASVDVRGGYQVPPSFSTASGLIADYTLERKAFQYHVKETLAKNFTTEERGVASTPAFITAASTTAYKAEKSTYDERLLLTAFSGKSELFEASYAFFGRKEPHYKVATLSLPAGENDAFTPVYKINYDPPISGEKSGYTTVDNGDGTSLRYNFSKNLTLESIQYFDGSILKKEKIFIWNEKNWLKSVEMRDENKRLFYKRSYEYDSYGNPIVEVFTGDLTGSGKEDSYLTKRLFSSDGYNLLLREEDGDGKVTHYTYLPNTNLVTSKIVSEGKKELLTEHFLYDSSNNLIEKRCESGFDEQKITRYTLRSSAPFLHMPQWIAEYFVEDGTEKLLKKQHLIYDKYGNITEEAIYGSDDKLAYTIYKKYSERGDLLSETNALGNKAIYDYDAKGRKISAKTFSGKLEKSYSYTANGHLREKCEKSSDGTLHITRGEYDLHSRCIKKTNHFGVEQNFTYDPLTEKVVKSEFLNEGVVAHAVYDVFGRKISETDPNGNTTKTRYNLYGSPVEIIHPNGGVESFRYEKNGRLSLHTDQDGVTTTYTYDVLGRVLFKRYLAQNREIGVEKFYYSPIHLLSETNRAGYQTEYSYDGAGRKVRESYCGRVTTYRYDALGRVSAICRENGKNSLLIHYTRDLEGRVVEERKCGAGGVLLQKIGYSYDVDGNRTEVTRYIAGGKAIDTFLYDGFAREIEHKDAAGYTSKTAYNEKCMGPSGNFVLQIARRDPLGIVTLERRDAFDKSVRKEILDSKGRVISCTEMVRDPAGNILYNNDYVYQNGKCEKTQVIKYTYTPDHKIATETRGSSEERKTTYTYTPSGKVATKEPPSGLTLHYSYHPFGYLTSLKSSDGSIHHTFDYNLLGKLISAEDKVEKTAIRREIDPFGDVTSETFPSGLTVNKEYDNLGRITRLKMDDSGEVIYGYDALFLRELKRLSRDGMLLYTHGYSEYDLNGTLIRETLPNNLGQIVHKTGPRGEKLSITSSYFTQKCTYDATLRLISNETGHFAYDDLSQLISEPGYTYQNDSLYNRRNKNGRPYQISELNERLANEKATYTFDANGNQLTKKTANETTSYTYDALNRLVKTTSPKESITFTYDPLCRRLTKTTKTFHENYLYDDEQEIGAFTSENRPKNLRTLGPIKPKNNPRTIAVEIDGKIYPALTDRQNNIRKLLDLSGATWATYTFSAFGEPTYTKEYILSPWRYASKRIDPELSLINFGKRYYVPESGRWLTTDPAGFIDSVNLYQYLLNNPFSYYDPDGQFLQLVAPWFTTVAIPWIVSTAVPWVFAKVVPVAILYLGGKELQDSIAKSRQNDYFDDTMYRNKKGGIDDTLPKDPFTDPDWENISHPKEEKNGHHTFKHKRNGDKIRLDKAKPGEGGHKEHDHIHRLNPKAKKGENNEYLDENGNATGRNSEPSHLYHPDNVWWNTMEPRMI